MLVLPFARSLLVIAVRIASLAFDARVGSAG